MENVLWTEKEKSKNCRSIQNVLTNSAQLSALLFMAHEKSQQAAKPFLGEEVGVGAVEKHHGAPTFVLRLGK